ncbi:hypothetical protein FA13DRAFT_293333 [Coprinellus micaceus]|uniref:Uncharacterized protein n=1 Tax=Coprinellus micaceus TaxID=71717 RepID=A0A4Y7TDL5_COPMI|nr:hypothetical protein FA13DRAFT_293333 [Coprinellus micaceus]
MRERLPPSEHLMLYQHLSRHAEVIYRHASRLQHVPEEEEGLYAVSGCMKSDSWALAGFIDPMVPPEDVLTLIKPHHSHSGTSPTGADRRYVWTNKGMADGFSGASREKSLQTHCLFVQGFKLGFSQSFRSRVRNSQPSDTSDSGSGPHDTSSPGPPPNGEDSNWNDLSPGKRGGSRFSSMFNRSKSNAGPSDTAFDLTSFPETNLSVVSAFPVSFSFSSFILLLHRLIIPAIQSIAIYWKR